MGVSLAVLLLLPVFSCSDSLAGWLRKVCFRCPVILGIKGTHPSVFDVFSCTFQILTVRAPSGLIMSHMTQGLSQYPATCKGRIMVIIPALPAAREASALWIMEPPRGGRVGTKENVLLGRAGRKAGQ